MPLAKELAFIFLSHEHSQNDVFACRSISCLCHIRREHMCLWVPMSRPRYRVALKYQLQPRQRWPFQTVLSQMPPLTNTNNVARTFILDLDQCHCCQLGVLTVCSEHMHLHSPPSNIQEFGLASSAPDTDHICCHSAAGCHQAGMWHWNVDRASLTPAIPNLSPDTYHV